MHCKPVHHEVDYCNYTDFLSTLLQAIHGDGAKLAAQTDEIRGQCQTIEFADDERSHDRLGYASDDELDRELNQQTDGGISCETGEDAKPPPYRIIGDTTILWFALSTSR